MITKMTGVLSRVLDDEVRLQIGAIEYQVMTPEFVRRTIQERQGQEVTLHITEYLEGNPNQGRMVPRLIGFMAESELEFFELFCTVDKVGVKKAMKALGRPIKEIAEAIQRQDHRWLSTLPGVGQATAEKIVATLRKKVARYAMLPEAGVAAHHPVVGGLRQVNHQRRLPGWIDGHAAERVTEDVEKNFCDERIQFGKMLGIISAA